MKYTVFTDCNFPRRKTNEDTFCIVENFFEKINLYCIFDGHSGNEVSEYLKNNFSTVLKEELINQNFIFNEFNENKWKKCLQNSFDKIEYELKKCCDSGSTLVVLMIDEDKNCYFANVGDSIGCILNEQIEKIGVKHRLDLISERERVEKSGGLVVRNRVNGILAISRAIGDFSMKPEVSSEPYVKICKLDQNDKIILASDGLWDFVTLNELFDFAKNNFDAEQIVNEFYCKSYDNITVITIE